MVGKMPFQTDRLKEVRIRLGLTQNELAQRLGTTQARLADWESGKNAPALKALESLALTLDVSADWLLGLSDEEKTVPNQSKMSSEERTVLHLMRRDKLTDVIIYILDLIKAKPAQSSSDASLREGLQALEINAYLLASVSSDNEKRLILDQQSKKIMDMLGDGE